MIQRVQSIFLLLAGAAALGVFALPFATTQASVQETVFADSIYNAQDHIGLIALFAVAGVLALVSIFLYKNRRVQMRLASLAFIANLFAIILGIVFFMQAKQAIGGGGVDDGFGMYLPIVTFICTFLAYRFINKDEKLVKSMDRLR